MLALSSSMETTAAIVDHITGSETKRYRNDHHDLGQADGMGKPRHDQNLFIQSLTPTSVMQSEAHIVY